MTNPVNVTKQILISFIPFGWIYTTSKINRLGTALMVLLPINIAGGIAIGVASAQVLPFPYGMVLAVAFHVAVIWFFIRRWSLQYNEKLASFIN